MRQSIKHAPSKPSSAKPCVKQATNCKPAWNSSARIKQETSTFQSSSSTSSTSRLPHHISPRVDASEEKKTLSLIYSLPNGAAAPCVKLYKEMVTARQTYERVCRRACRDLSAATAEWKERLGDAADRESHLLDLTEEAVAQSKSQEAQIALLLQALAYCQ